MLVLIFTLLGSSVLKVCINLLNSRPGIQVHGLVVIGEYSAEVRTFVEVEAPPKKVINTILANNRRQVDQSY